MSPLIFNEKVPTERIFILLHIKIKGFAVLKERFKWKSFSITIKCFLLLIVAVWSFMNTKNCTSVFNLTYISLPVFAPPLPSLCFIPLSVLTALALAMGRDNVSGGIAHLVVITEKGVEHVVVPGDKLPKFHDEWLPSFFFFFFALWRNCFESQSHNFITQTCFQTYERSVSLIDKLNVETEL